MDDHCHLPTLEKLPRDLPVVAQPDAAEKCRKLGYKQIYELDHGQTVTIAGGKLTLTGTEGGQITPKTTVCLVPLARRQGACKQPPD